MDLALNVIKIVNNVKINKIVFNVHKAIFLKNKWFTIYYQKFTNANFLDR